MTYRDANAHTLADFLDTKVRIPEPPTLAPPSNLAASERSCDSGAVEFEVFPNPPSPPRPRQRLVVRFYGGGDEPRTLSLALSTNSGSLSNLTIELVQGNRVIAQAALRRIGTTRTQIVLRPRHGARFAPGGYRLVVRRARITLLDRSVSVH
jgi:hypothetical protein